MESKKTSPLIKWAIPVIVIVGILAVVIASRIHPKKGLEETVKGNDGGEIGSISTDSGILPGKKPAMLLIDSSEGPHMVGQEAKAANCASCHQSQYDDWLGSPHAMASSGETYQSALTLIALERGPDTVRKCLQCHIPHDPEGVSIGPGGTFSPDATQSEGVNCHTCHFSDRIANLVNIVWPGVDPKTVTPNSPKFCGLCHAQAEPVLPLLDPSVEFRQTAGDTYVEWLAGPYSSGVNYKSCLDCHGGGGNGTGTVHRWPRDKSELVRSGYTVDLIPLTTDKGIFRTGIRITNSGAGHQIPTGDPGHMLIFNAVLITPEGAVLTVGELKLDALHKRLSPGETVELPLTINDSGGFLLGLNNLSVQYKVTYGFDLVAEQVLSLGPTFGPTVIDENILDINEPPATKE